MAVELEWRKRYLGDSPPPLRTIGRILRDLHLSGSRKKRKRRGVAKYQCYPEHSIYTLLGGRVLEADFIGQKYIQGRSEPLNFIGFSFKKPPRLRFFKRIEAQTTDCFIEGCTEFFRQFETPDFVKVDNCMATIGSASVKRSLSRFMEFLLKHQVIPIFAVPRKPFSQASIEGNNSVFSRKFWNRIHFKTLKEVDQRLGTFNQESQEYLSYQRPQKTQPKKRFIPRIYFIRKVQEDKNLKRAKGYIDILNERIKLPNAYVNYYILAEWNLKIQQLIIYFEKDQKQKTIKQIPFLIDPKSKKRCTDFI